MIRIGTAGWSIRSDAAGAFPGEGTHLQRYAGRLDAVEINSSFYRPHRPSTYERWSRSVPDGFRFAVKAPKTVTHERRLQACEDLVHRFLAEAAGLGSKLGVILVQLPPTLSFQARVADDFFGVLREASPAPLACEPRHRSWFGDAAEALLAKHDVARVAADPALAPGADQPGGWGGLVYYRMHGSPRIYWSDYGEATLGTIAAQLQATVARAADAWCIFDNTAAGHATANALWVQDRLR